MLCIMAEATAEASAQVGRTLSRKFMARQDRRREAQQPGSTAAPDMGRARPKVRRDCCQEARPCPWVRCRHHLFLEVRKNGSLNFPHGQDVKALFRMSATCSLDVAALGTQTLEQCRKHFGDVTRERIRQEQDVALAKLKEALPSSVQDPDAIIASSDEASYVGSPQNETLQALGLERHAPWLTKIWSDTLKETEETPW